MNTVASILKELPRYTGEWNAADNLPDSPLAVIVIANGDAPASQVTAHVICVDMRTVGVIVAPHHWEAPPAPQRWKLWAPPDPLGWRVNDIMEQAQVNRIQFWNRDHHESLTEPA